MGRLCLRISRNPPDFERPIARNGKAYVFITFFLCNCSCQVNLPLKASWTVDTLQVWTVDTLQVWTVETLQVWTVETLQVRVYILQKWQYVTAIQHKFTSVRNKASPLNNHWLKLLRTDCFQNLSDKLSDLTPNLCYGLDFSLWQPE